MSRLRGLLIAMTLAIAIESPITAITAERKGTVQELYSQCTKPDRDIEKIICLMYIAGVADAMTMAGAYAKVMSGEGGLANSDDRKTMLLISQCGDASLGARVQAFNN